MYYLQLKGVLYSTQNDIFNYGDVILVKGNPTFLEKQKNPHAFDYAKFLQRKGIFLQAFCSRENFMVVGTDNSPVFQYWLLRTGDFFEEILTNRIKSTRELDMIRAMVIGRRHEVTPEMEFVYEATGTSNILAVSGLHVGIIYLVLKVIFGFAKRKGWRWLYYPLIIASIWTFALITGLSPSVSRAALMFTFVLIAEMSQRKSNIYNTILASAFCILLFAPNLIFSVLSSFLMWRC